VQENTFAVPDAAPADVPAVLRAPAIASPTVAEMGGKRLELCEQACE
jgi:hypothetical protein